MHWIEFNENFSKNDDLKVEWCYVTLTRQSIQSLIISMA